QANRPAHGDDVDGHEHLVQDQDTGIQGRTGARRHTGPFLRGARRPAPGRALSVACVRYDAPGRSRVRVLVIITAVARGTQAHGQKNVPPSPRPQRDAPGENVPSRRPPDWPSGSPTPAAGRWNWSKT